MRLGGLRGILLAIMLVGTAIMLAPPVALADDPSVSITSPADDATVAYADLELTFTVAGALEGDTVSCWFGTTRYRGCGTGCVPPAAGDGPMLISVILYNSSDEVLASDFVSLTVTDSPPGDGETGVDPDCGTAATIEIPGGGGTTEPPPVGNDNDYQPAKSKPLIGVAPKTVRVGKSIKLELYCPDGCTLALSLKLGKKKVSGLKSVKVALGQSTAKFKLPSKIVKKIRAALKKSNRTRAQLTITPMSKHGKGRPAKINIKR